MKMIERLHAGLSVFRILTSILNKEDDQMASSQLDEVSKISAFILNVEDNEFGSTRLICLVLVVVSFGHR